MTKQIRCLRVLVEGGVILAAILLVGCGGEDPVGPAPTTLRITTATLPHAIHNRDYGTQALRATGGGGDYSWVLASGSLPTALSLTSAGVVTGTPTVVETSRFTVEVTSTDGQVVERSLSISVKPLLRITTTSLPDAGQNIAYREVLAATGGDGSYAWTLVSGSMPDRLDLAATGIVTGTPASVATARFTIQVLSRDGQVARQALSISVIMPPVLQPSDLCTDSSRYAIPTFEDPNLEAVVRAHPRVSAQEDWSCLGVSNVWDLSAPSSGVISLEGVQNLTNLQALYLQNNLVTDVSPLAGLTRFTLLHLADNSITDIGPLAGLTDLTWLNLDNNSITDINPLIGMTSLADLRLGINSITDISALSGLTSLTRLSIDSNSITDVSALSGLARLATLLLDSNSIADVSPLSELRSLTSLSLGDNSITNISPVAGLTSLTLLSLAGNSITDISALSALTSLTVLSLTDNSLSDISALSALTSVIDLYLSNTSITDVSALVGLTALRWLFLKDNRDLSDIEALLDNTGLETGDTIDLRDTGVSCLDAAALEARGVTVYSEFSAPPEWETSVC